MIAPFALHRPTTTSEAVMMLRDLAHAAPYAGGTELIQVMKMGLARFDHLIDLKRIEDLRRVEEADDGSLRIGAAVSHRTIEQSEVVRRRYRTLAGLARHVANVRVRNVGTIGGNLSFAEPHSDPATLLVACGASVELTGTDGARLLPVNEFIVDALETRLDRGELLTSVILPPLPSGARVAYRRFVLAERPTVTAASRVALADGAIVDAQIVVGAVGPRPQGCRQASGMLGLSQPEAIRSISDVAASCAADLEIIEDIDASADFKRHLVGVLVKRALGDVLSAAT